VHSIFAPTAIASDWSSWPDAPSSGNRPSSWSNLTPFFVGIAICFAVIGDTNQGTKTTAVAPETIALIRRSAKENRLWGAERIRGELLKLGVRVSKRTIQKYMPKVRRDSSQTWAAFLSNHAGHLWACDFTFAHDLLFRALYIFVVMELQSRVGESCIRP
jgi:hypothetical protein